MSTLSVAPSVVTIFNGAAGAVAVTASTTNAGPISATLEDGSVVTLSATSIPGSTGTLTLTPISTNTNGGDDALVLSDGQSTVIVPIAVGAMAAASEPLSNVTTLATMMAYVRQLADAPSSPVDANLGMLLNQAIIQVSDNLAPSLKTVQLPVIPGTSTVTLPGDVGDIEAIVFNTGDSNVPGSIPYTMMELGPTEFADFNAGTGNGYGLFPSGPVLYYQRLSDVGGRIRLQCTPYPPAGFFVLTYHPRLSIFNLGSPNSSLDMDPSYVRLVALLTAHDVCLTNRDTARAQYLDGQYTRLMSEKKIALGRRNNARTSTVRDVTSGVYDASPPWWR